MSVENVVSNVNLVEDQIFDHTFVIKREIDRIYDNFEKNERFKEFDGLIRASHALIEATDATLETLVNDDELKKLNDEIKLLTKSILQLSVPKQCFPTRIYSCYFPFKEHDEYLEAIRKEQEQHVRVVETVVQQRIQNLKDEHIRNRIEQTGTSLDASIASEVDLG
uniref:Biogenesis of lysosome-related organelles complex 1 subunit 5 n=1 Tax=Syphacia muris TaxID=451379 RepID=A0A0N5ALC0_9BILA